MNAALADDSRMIVYSGDDQWSGCACKIVSRDRFDPFNREANLGLLESGMLCVACFSDEDDGLPDSRRPAGGVIGT